MYNLRFLLKNEPGQLSLMGNTLGKSGISVQGGGMWTVGDVGQANFLFSDGEAAKRILESAGISVVSVDRVIVQKLRQDIPGQLGLFTQRLKEAGINIHVLYSDHNNQLIVVTDNNDKAQYISQQWMHEFWSN